jgi:dihydrofolate synthase/folylpolyglutamate synthase
MSSYSETLAYLYSRLPMFSKIGNSAIKKDLTNTIKLCEFLGNPQDQFKSIHIAGTNGKGSTSNMLAAILQTSGYKTGLYTSPHLLDFRERIRINGDMIPEEKVIEFVKHNKDFIEELKPSFFEVTVAMAFLHFAEQNVDIAVIETGLGGRLDSTNIIHPILSIITNISLDHTSLLGNTLEAIAYEKAGIIKKDTPVIISEKADATSSVFLDKAEATQSKIIFASDQWRIETLNKGKESLSLQVSKLTEDLPNQKNSALTIELDLPGIYQTKNIKGVLSTVDELRLQGYKIADNDVLHALSHVKELTGLRARWQTLSHDPLIICDTGHNEAGWEEVLLNINQTPFKNLHMVVGIMRDKNSDKLLSIFPSEATYYFCNADFERALPAQELQEQASHKNLSGKFYPDVLSALEVAIKNAKPEDLIFIGGSTFIVAEALKRFV